MRDARVGAACGCSQPPHVGPIQRRVSTGGTVRRGPHPIHLARQRHHRLIRQARQQRLLQLVPGNDGRGRVHDDGVVAEVVRARHRAPLVAVATDGVEDAITKRVKRSEGVLVGQADAPSARPQRRCPLVHMHLHEPPQRVPGYVCGGLPRRCMCLDVTRSSSSGMGVPAAHPMPQSRHTLPCRTALLRCASSQRLARERVASHAPTRAGPQ